MSTSQNTRHSAEDTAAQESPLAPEPAGTVGADTISLARRNLACARVRVLAGLTLGSGIVITLSAMHTTVSSPG
ncbi:hypothetical protein [Streptomyces lushanensis]|uniref:hypothetical protein n=1 Tax=Streptomyces lushanensis TaxID=1434255 RepID=UPI000834E0D5|nr:hypothetical protein [Streptomyces lushanensis]